jgi:hypothetical protein
MLDLKLTLGAFALATIATMTTTAAQAQSVPACPLCAAAGYAAQRSGELPDKNTASVLLPKGYFALSSLSSKGLVGRTETFLRYGFSDKLSGGFAFLQKQQTLRPSLSYVLTKETVEMPSVSMGIFHDSVSSGRTAYHVTAGRTITDMGNKPFSGYLGLAKVSRESGLRTLAGVSLPLGAGLTTSLQWDGKRGNLGLVGDLGKIAGYPIRLGLVAVGSDLGPLFATQWKK